MNQQAITSHVVAIVLAFFLVVPLLDVLADASTINLYRQPSSADLYTVADQIESSYAVWVLLKNKGFLVDDLSYEDFDYICVLTQQLCQSTKHVKPSLALAVIAIESNFDASAQNGNARGLMQLIPAYHYDRMSYFVENPDSISTDDFFNPRLNIATGLDYLDSILDATDENVKYSLMWYNQGPISASKSYLDDHHVSSYAKAVRKLSNEIRYLLREEVADCS